MAVPRPTGPRVQRAALLRRIESAAEPLVLLVAPSGFGKTSLLAEWATTTDAQVAWLSCDETDGEPAQVWSRLSSTLAARWPAMGSDAALILERPSWDAPELVDSLARDLADLPVPASVVIDDAQFAEASQRTLASVAQRLPAHVRLLVASQHNPAFPTSRLRLAGVITELRAADLAFTDIEVEQLLELATLERKPIDGRRLRTLTEGWPAGLQMAVLAMRAGGDPREVIEAFASTTKKMSDYLANEVLNRLPPDLAGFLTSICVLDEFDAPLCQVLSGRDDAGRLLDRVVADDLFIYQVDHAGERFRLHQMFAAFLRARLKSLGTQFREAHLRAAAALQERGDRLGALHHAMAVADMPLAADILAGTMHTILDVTHAHEAKAVARAWLAKFGDAAAEANPEQLLQFVLLLAASGQREAEDWLTKVNRAHPSPAPGLDALAHATWAAYHRDRARRGTGHAARLSGRSASTPRTARPSQATEHRHSRCQCGGRFHAHQGQEEGRPRRHRARAAVSADDADRAAPGVPGGRTGPEDGLESRRGRARSSAAAPQGHAVDRRRGPGLHEHRPPRSSPRDMAAVPAGPAPRGSGRPSLGFGGPDRVHAHRRPRPGNRGRQGARTGDRQDARRRADAPARSSAKNGWQQERRTGQAVTAATSPPTRSVPVTARSAYAAPSTAS